MDEGPFRKIETGDSDVLEYKQGFGCLAAFGILWTSIMLTLLIRIPLPTKMPNDLYGLFCVLLVPFLLISLAYSGVVMTIGRGYFRIDKKAGMVSVRSVYSLVWWPKQYSIQNFSGCRLVECYRGSGSSKYLAYRLILQKIGQGETDIWVWESSDQGKMEAIEHEVKTFMGWPIEKKSTSTPDSASGIPRA